MNRLKTVTASVILIAISACIASQRMTEEGIMKGSSYLVNTIKTEGFNGLRTAKCDSKDPFYLQGERGNLAYLALYLQTIHHVSTSTGEPNDIVEQGRRYIRERATQAWYGYGEGFVCTAIDSAFVYEFLQEYDASTDVTPLLVFQNRGFLPHFCAGSHPCTFMKNDTMFWCNEDTQTTALITNLLIRSHGNYSEEIKKARAFLRDQQRGDGSWLFYWMPNQYYSTYKTALVFDPGTEQDRAVRFILSTQNIDGSWGNDKDAVISTASSLLLLQMLGENPEAVKRGREWLLTHQNSDGSWEGGSIVSYSRENEDGLEYVVCQDHKNLFATSLALEALLINDGKVRGRVVTEARGVSPLTPTEVIRETTASKIGKFTN